MSLGVVVLSAAVALTSGALVSILGLDVALPVAMTMGAVVGIAVGSTIASIVESGVAMIFVCLAEDPNILQVLFEYYIYIIVCYTSLSSLNLTYPHLMHLEGHPSEAICRAQRRMEQHSKPRRRGLEKGSHAIRFSWHA